MAFNNNYNEIELDKLIKKIIDNRGKTPPRSKFGHKLIEINSIVGESKFPNYSTIKKFVSEKTYETWFRNGHPQKGDILISTVGSIGNVVIMNDNKGCIAQNLVGLKLDEKYCFNEYIYYYLSNKKIQQKLKNLNIGSVQPSLKIPHLLKLKLKLPVLEEQKAIANILSSLDEKIELNNQMNQTLEEMAQAIYKSWFVDFEPWQDGEFVDSELGKIPKGFEVINIGDAIDTLGGSTPRTKNEEYWNGDIIWFTPSDITSNGGMFITESSRKITEEGFDNSYTKLFQPYSVMMTSRATVGEVAINRNPACTNQGFINLIPNNNFSMYQLYFWIKDNKELIISRANGSTFKEISKTNFRALPIVKADNSPKYQEFINISKSMFDKIEQLTLENKTLVQLRDTLLPKLMSGEVRTIDN